MLYPFCHRRWILILFLTVFASFDRAAHSEDIVVSFQLHAPEIPENTKVYITGNTAELGTWHPGKVQMKYEGDQNWTFNLTLSKPRTLEYKYTLGSWVREGASEKGRPLANSVLHVTKSITRRDKIERWTEKTSSKFQGQVTGQVHIHRQITGKGIRPRDITVWLPPGYENSDSRYPVLYMHDGQNIFDPKTSAFGRDWEVDETCTRLIGPKQIEPLIVVAIYNTPDRSAEYMVGEKGNAYRNFVSGKLKSFIDEHYRTKPSREHTMTAGSSAGGLCAFILTWEHSEIFSKAICMSPAFRFTRDDETVVVDYVAAIQKSERPANPIFIYIDNGGVGLEKKLQPGVDAMLEVLQAKGLKPVIHFKSVQAPDARHNEAAWAKRFPSALKSILD